MGKRLDLVVTVALLAGCSGSPGPVRVATCSPSCPAGLACNSGRCGPITCSSTTRCPAGLSCIAGFCANQSCEPACASGQVCLDQTCVAGSAADAGSLTCAVPYQLCASANGDDYCAATLSDSSNCGGCGRTCATGEVCNGAGTCALACAAGEVVCGKRCVSLSTDRANCGACGTACASGQVCTAGACAATCAAPEISCGASCADTAVDPESCGSCGAACQAGQLCVNGSCTVACGGALAACNGVCTDLEFDGANCGACGATCGADQRCFRGDCTACGTLGELCCAGEICGADLTCVGEVCAAPPDGGTDAGFTFTTLLLLAGSPGGVGNADGTGASARFDQPSALVYDGLGTLYAVDLQNDLVRQIAVASAAVTTLPGSGAALLNNGPFLPCGLALDGPGTLDIADTAAGRIFAYALESGTLDGAVPDAGFSFPAGLAYDGVGDLFVANRLDDTVREITLASGAVTTLAGASGVSGSADGTGIGATFDSPQGLAYDSLLGALYVADTGNDTIREITVATGAVTTLAGIPGDAGSADGPRAAATFFGPIGLAYDGVQNLYVADVSNNTLRTIDLASGAVTTLAGSAGDAGSTDGTGPAATFDLPYAIAYDDAGTVYVADTGNSVIRAVAVPTGAVTTLAGAVSGAGDANGAGSAAGFAGPMGLAYDALTGTLYVADSANDLIRAIDVATGAVTTLAGASLDAGSADGTGGAALFDGPEGVAYDAPDGLYLTDTNNDTIRAIDLATGTVITLAGSAMSEGSVDGTGAAARFFFPSGIACDGAGDVYIADSYNQTIRRLVVATGAVTTLAGTPGITGSSDGTGAAASFSGPHGLAYDGAGTLYVADSYNQTIRAIDVATAAVTTLAGTAQSFGSADGIGASATFESPTCLAYDGAGDLYVGDFTTIRAINVATASVTTVAGVPNQYGLQPGVLPAKLGVTNGLALGPGPTLFISSENTIVELR